MSRFTAPAFPGNLPLAILRYTGGGGGALSRVSLRTSVLASVSPDHTQITTFHWADLNKIVVE